MHLKGPVQRIWLAGLTVSVTGTFVSAESPTNDVGRKFLSRLQALRTPDVETGALIVDLSSGEVLLDHQSDTPLVPASNQKLFVMAAAVDLLGPEFTFRTMLAVRGRDVIVIGDGDPGFGDPRLAEANGHPISRIFERWADALKCAGRRRLEGDLILDESLFDAQTVHPSWDPRELDHWYAAPVGALNLNDNCLEFIVWPSGPIGAPPNWRVVPELEGLALVNRARGGGKGTPAIGRVADLDTYVLTGSCPRRSTLQSVAVHDPGMLFGNSLRTVLARCGVRIDGALRRERVRLANGELPSDVTILADHTTPLTDVLSRIGKDSQNLFAECLAKRLGYEHLRRSQHPDPVGSWPAAADAMRDFLQRRSIDATGLVLADASGLSRDNRATAKQFVGILYVMQDHPHKDLFFDALAIAGRDGSLRKRMRDVEGEVIGKTGTLRGIKSLSGCVTNPDGRSYALCTIFNGFKGSSAPYKSLQDDLCRMLSAPAGSRPK